MMQLELCGIGRTVALVAACASLTVACGGKGLRAPRDDGGSQSDGPGSSGDVLGVGIGGDGGGAHDGAPADGPSGKGDANAGGDTAGDDTAIGGNDAGGDTAIGGNDAGGDARGGCPVDCTHLPHVAGGANLGCNNGECVIPSGVCEPGYAHCRGSGNGGCETSLATVTDCGSCNFACSATGAECKGVESVYRCVGPCGGPAPDACGFLCVDLQSDDNNCGSCGHHCSSANGYSSCVAGQCLTNGCVDGFADCTGADDGCETPLGSSTDCGACGDQPCHVANTLFTCHDGATVCAAAPCAAGFANCDLASPDCEATFASTASCLPSYIDTFAIAAGGGDLVLTAVAADGSVFLAGAWTGLVDFDASAAGKDIRSTNDVDAFVTKLNPDGSYAWTASLGGRGSSNVTGLAVTPTGAVVVSGTYNDTIALDPTGAGAPLETPSPDETDPYFAELTAAGQLAWGGTFRGQRGPGYVASVSVAVDASGAVFLAGTHDGSFDFDPGPNDASHATTTDSGVLVKLSPTGAFQSARFYDNDGCTAALSAVTVASDGSVWAVGTATTGASCPLDPRAAPAGGGSVMIVKHDGANTPVGKWLLGPSPTVAGTAVAAGPGGAIFVGGNIGPTDFDPGPGVARRWTGANGGGFIVKLDAGAGFQWVRTVVDGEIDGLTATPDGGVIALGGQQDALIMRLTTDGGAIWTFDVGGTTPGSVASGAGRFAIAGRSSGNVDMNPGPALDLVTGDVTFVSRYSF